MPLRRLRITDAILERALQNLQTVMRVDHLELLPNPLSPSLWRIVDANRGCAVLGEDGRWYTRRELYDRIVFAIAAIAESYLIANYKRIV